MVRSNIKVICYHRTLNHVTWHVFAECAAGRPFSFNQDTTFADILNAFLLPIIYLAVLVSICLRDFFCSKPYFTHIYILLQYV